MNNGWFGNRYASAILLLLGFAPLFFVKGYLIDGWASRGWPMAEGEIISMQERTGIRKGVDTYSLEATYRYEVNGRKLLGDQITLQGELNPPTQNQNDEQARIFAEGNIVDVYYNPDDPEQAVLIPGFPSAVSTPLLLTALLWIVAVLNLLVWWKMIRPMQELERRRQELLKGNRSAAD